ncbi:hypothetical protein N7466_011544 [Penicillium verhagenii]|uniref:uncharacterized protein n=1 Tax=Penicillium verhagenii TaxID=1562060 RepID=UPI0025454CDE|nr:uncharacterized protein N7466_011544 [Penicillium verhagenii]KAJ5915611.1 hypothetical protein N7466_011544 [Penicillium verhagenii]
MARPSGQIEHLITNIQQLEESQINPSQTFRAQSRKMEIFVRTIKGLEQHLDERDVDQSRMIQYG